jgi:hypothetical protein
MNQGNEALNAPSLQFFIASLPHIFTLHLTLHRCFFYRNSSLNASLLFLFKLTLPTSANQILSLISIADVMDF